MREAFVQILHHHLGFVEHQIAVEQRGDTVVRIEIGELLGMLILGYLDDINSHTLLGEHNTHAMTVMIIAPGIEDHR